MMQGLISWGQPSGVCLALVGSRPGLRLQTLFFCLWLPKLADSQSLYLPIISNFNSAIPGISYGKCPDPCNLGDKPFLPTGHRLFISGEI
jgi:hypothetical protein